MTDGRAAPRRSRASRAGWALFALADAPVVAGVGAGLLAAYLAPRTLWWTQLVAIGVPYLVWPLAALGVVWLLGRWWKTAALHALLVACVVVRAGGPGRFSAPPPAPEDLALTTFNVPQVGPSEEVLADSVSAFVTADQPDLLLLQDVRVMRRFARRMRVQVSVQVETIRQRLPYALPVPPLAATAGAVQRIEVPLLVRRGAGVEVLEQQMLQTGDPDDIDGSHALRSRIRWDGREAVVYNVHLRSFGTDKPWDDPAVGVFRPRTWAPYLRRYRVVYAQRDAEAVELAAHIAAETLPVVVAGDFNSTADNWSYHRLRTAGGVDRVDAMQAVGGSQWGRTYHAERPFVRIDFVLVDPAFEVTAAATTPVTFSDHRPVSVRLRWRDGAGDS